MEGKSSFRNLLISRIFGTSSSSNACFSCTNNIIAYAASGGVVISEIDVNENNEPIGVLSQRFFCASSKSTEQDCSLISSMPKDSFGLVKPEASLVIRSMSLTEPENMEKLNRNVVSDLQPAKISPSKIKDRIKTISCLTLSPDGKLLIVGESGHQPRILIYSMAPNSNDFPIFVIYQHSFGISHLKFNPNNSKLFVSLGQVNDGFFHAWKITATNVHLIGSNKNSSIVNGLVWTGNDVITYGMRHLKLWKLTSHVNFSPVQNIKSISRTIKGKNVVLGSYIYSTFIDADELDNGNILLLTDSSHIIVYVDGNLISSYNLLENSHGKFNNIIIDSSNERIWGDCNGVVEYLSLNSILSHQKKLKYTNLAPELDHSKYTKQPVCMSPKMFSLPSSPTPNNKLMLISSEIISIMKFDQSYIIYFSKKGEVTIMNVKTNESRIIIDPLLNNINGYKKLPENQILLWSKKGDFKILNADTCYLDTCSLPLLTKLVQEYNLENEITAADTFKNKDNTVFLITGDKLGYLAIYQRLNDQTQCIFSVKAHSSTINDLICFDVGDKESLSIIVSISRDRMVQIFIQNNGKWELFETLDNHKGNLMMMERVRNKLYIASNDRTVTSYVFDYNNSQLVICKEMVFAIKSTPIALQVNSDYMIISTNDKQILIYNLQSFGLERMLRLCNEQNDPILVNKFLVNSTGEEIICSSSADKSLRCYNFNSGKLFKEYFCHANTLIGVIQTQNGNLLSISSNGCVFYWSQQKNLRNENKNSFHYDMSPLTREYASLNISSTSKIVERKIKKLDSTTSKPSQSKQPSLSPVKLPHTPKVLSSTPYSPLYSKSIQRNSGTFSSTESFNKNVHLSSLLSQLKRFRTHILPNEELHQNEYDAIIREIKIINALVEPHDNLLTKYSDSLLMLVEERLRNI